ncbi:MAG: serine hydrolase, partial [Lachnospiraceae bacterium]|nr:serine hydrolase [Lachnospiraceae bacterium]
MKFFTHKHTAFLSVSVMCLCISLILPHMTAFAETDYYAEAEARKSLPIETNEIENWPVGPEIGAESAILLEANSGAVLYAKNINEQLYPASVTKILTALIAAEKCEMDEIVTFSSDAIHSINWREDANMGINVGDQITMEQCLYGLLVGSANEAAYAIAEHISGEGNLDGFAALMNEKAKELGCTNSNFVTPNGIHDENHYTSAHDLALIAQAFFSNELLTKMSSTTSYQIPKTATQPREDMIVWAKSKLLPGKEYAYEPLLGTKTGY